MLGLIFVGSISALSGWFYRENKVYKPKYERIRQQVHAEDQEAMRENRKPQTGEIRYTVKYREEDIGKINKHIELETYYYECGLKHKRTVTLTVPINASNTHNNIVFHNQGNCNKDWRRGDIVIIFEKMNWAESAQKHIIDKLRSCYGNRSESEIRNMASAIREKISGYGSISVPNPLSPSSPIVFNRGTIPV